MVIILAGELLKKPVNFPVMGLHRSEVIKGYKLACAKALGELETYCPLSHRSSPQTLSTRFRQLEKIFKEIPDSGIEVIIAGSFISDFALHYLNRFNIAVLKATPLAHTPQRKPGHVETTEISGDRVTRGDGQPSRRSRAPRLVPGVDTTEPELGKRV
ncbi:uncharacterized protein F5147DRAFT_657722 [Suillus discolor]|uniref:Uncharacterized protein n=1 Tax=Suillus discolor TaxID=1912936 RepID=A0A9P7JNH4_9AGAM|nr:uncharacterized protein F5147DRAFT_657722 [Suillus discolor]KAG2092316.1 hypothetical protein F5147DRAFT_657722 [Suillus discolor]